MLKNKFGRKKSEGSPISSPLVVKKSDDTSNTGLLEEGYGSLGENVRTFCHSCL